MNIIYFTTTLMKKHFAFLFMGLALAFGFSLFGCKDTSDDGKGDELICPANSKDKFASAISKTDLDGIKCGLRDGALFEEYTNSFMEVLNMFANLYKEDLTYDFVKFYIDEGYEVDRRIHGMTMLHIMAFIGDIQSIKYLMEHGANVNAFTDSHLTPLMMGLIGKNSLEVTKTLLKSDDIEVNITDDKVGGIDILAVMKAMLGEGSEDMILTSTSPSIITALMIATILGKTEEIAILVKSGAKVTGPTCEFIKNEMLHSVKPQQIAELQQIVDLLGKDCASEGVNIELKSP